MKPYRGQSVVSCNELKCNKANDGNVVPECLGCKKSEIKIIDLKSKCLKKIDFKETKKRVKNGL